MKYWNTKFATTALGALRVYHVTRDTCALDSQSSNQKIEFAYHPSIPVSQETTPKQYWLKVKNNVINKFIDNLYENKAPLIISVRVFNCDKYKNTVIEETYVRDKNT